jgi:Fe2+ or Zn2+ uptake regulation protein
MPSPPCPESGFEITGFSLEFEGICPDCRHHT